MTGQHPVDGISEAHRTTWSRLSRFRTASIAAPPYTLRDDEPDQGIETTI
ncbi:hypothetical protein [Curtobacterium sp. Leaf261]|nr:hypothetical protein [Curtobacterium sp. Leaf261]